MPALVGTVRARTCVALVAVAALATTLLPAHPAAQAEATAPGAGYAVRAMTFNILSGTMAPGGITRANRAADQVHRTSRNLVAFQEVSIDQFPVLRRRLPGFSFWPRRAYGPYDSAIQIAWRRSEFTAVAKGLIYRPFLGRMRAIPYVKLKNDRTGRRFAVVAIHNAPGGGERDRDISTVKEIRLIKRLQASGNPVLVMGDMNERVEFCQRVNRATGLVSLGGTPRNPCPVPRRAGPDWMMATWQGSDFGSYRKVYNGISDHPMVVGNLWVERRS